ncbi:MAG: ElyC/SanA/YdcF family protein [Myxococcota bacterium]
MLRELGEIAPIPSLKHSPDPRKVLFWSGAELAVEPPDPASYVHCRPCDCSVEGTLTGWPDWLELNRHAYAHLRTARAPYPVAIIPGFHAGGLIADYRLKIGLKLMSRGWVAALILSGGHQRGGRNEARYLVARARALAERYEVDVTDRLFVEPCACHTVTNLRNGLRLMAAHGLSHGLFISDAQMSGQAAVFATNLDALVAQDLNCPVGRVSHILGYTPWGRWDETGNGCRAPITLTNNPVLFVLPNRRLSVFWVSPFMQPGNPEMSVLACHGGSERILDCEPEGMDPFVSACQPVSGRGDQTCEP